MSRLRNVKLFLEDGTLDGFVEAKRRNWPGVVYHLLRQALREHKEDSSIKRGGIYFLLGQNANGERTVYVGQADKRSNGNGINQRLDEHTRDGLKDWTEAIYITTHGEPLDATKLKYLEYRFYMFAKRVFGKNIRNGQAPFPGNPSSTVQCGLDEFVENACHILSLFGLPITVSKCSTADASTSSIVVQSVPDVPPSAQLRLDVKGVTAYARKTENGELIVLATSRIVLQCTEACPKAVERRREEAKREGILSDDGILLKDLFPLKLSAASDFVLGRSSDGKEWREIGVGGAQ